MNKVLLGWNIVLTVALIVMSVVLVQTMDRADLVNQRVSVIENGLSSVEQYLEPSYHIHLWDEIQNLWEEIQNLKAR